MRPFPAPVSALCLLLAALTFWSLPAGHAQAATRDFYFTTLAREQGLRQNTVTAIVQDRQGFVWVGTQGGLHRYDGQRYTSFRHDPRDVATLPDSFVASMAVGQGDVLWVGTNSQYVARLDLATGHVRRFDPGDETAPAQRQVMALLPQGDRVWVATPAGLRVLDPRDGRSRTVLRLAAVPQRSRQALVPAAGGGVWFGTPGGLYRVQADGRSQRIGPAEPVRSLQAGADGDLWVGRLDGIHRLGNGADRLERVWPADGAGAGVHDIQALARAPDGWIWAASYGEGLVRLDPATRAARLISSNDESESQLPEDAISTLFVDTGGILWVGGTFRGVAVADTRGTRFNYVLGAGATEAGIAADSVRAIVQDDDGSLWVGTDTAHLLRYEPAANRLDDHSRLLPGGQTTDTRTRVTALADAGTRAAWVGTNRGLFRLDTTARRLQPAAVDGLGSVAVRSLLRARDGGLWIGTSGAGLIRLRADGTLQRFGAEAPGLAHPTVHALLEDRRGRVWAGTGDGLALLDPASGRLRAFRHVPNNGTSLPGNLVRALHQAHDGAIWVGTHAGLSRVVEENGTAGAERISFAHPLAEHLGNRPVPTVFTIAEGPPGWLWLGTDDGIVRFDTRTERSRHYRPADGLQDLEFNGGAVASLSDGRLAFGGVRGLNLFDPTRMQDRTFAPPVRLLSARIGADAPGEEGALWQPERLELPDSADLLRLRIGALDYSPAADLRYRYRLEGFDKGWIDNGAQQDITYTRLPPGRYEFRAQASNHGGGWSEQELRIPVDVLPPAWRHPLALIGMGLFALALIGAVAWRLRERRREELGWFAQIREREERLKLALWASGEQFWDYDLRTRMLHRMRVDEEVGPSPDIGVQSAVESEHEIHPDDRGRVQEQLRQHLRGDAALFLSEHRIRAGERWAWVRARGRVVERDADGRAVRVAGTARDVSAVRSAERERRVSSEVLRSMAEAVAVFDRDFTFVSVNPAFARTTGYSATEVEGRPTRLLDSAQHDPDVYRQMRAELERNGRWSGELWQRRKDGTEFLCWLQASAVEDNGDGREHYVVVLSDITDQKRAEQELRYLANYDTLTSLPNRTLLSERLSRAIVRARRTGRKIALLFLDLDRFKDINDSLGHAAGDRILRAAATRLQQTVGAGQTVARLGGDEFTVVLENLSDPAQAEQIAREIIAAFAVPLDLDDHRDLAISPSIGISLYPDDAQVPTDLLKHADTAMYQAKAIGRRTFMRYDEAMDVEIRRRATISGALRNVLDRDELHLVFQPRLSLPDQRITGVEALLRWSSVEHGEVPPGQFIPLAEESGLILEIGEWVLQEACLVLQRWRQRGFTDLTMAVNVSALQLLRGDLPSVVARVLEETGVPANRLELELTESVLMANAKGTADTLQAFRELGVGLAVDDFGTGYSSLAYLKRLPLTTLKIDKAFIADITRDADDEAITSTVIAMAHSLGLNVVAEGVETPAQLQFLRDHHCDEIQGWWLTPALESQQCVSFIRDWTPHPPERPAP